MLKCSGDKKPKRKQKCCRGPRGIRGVDGPTGDVGPTGAQGPTGMKGDQGDRGDTGAQGPTGMKGDKGDRGDTGAQGPTGPGLIQDSLTGIAQWTGPFASTQTGTFSLTRTGNLVTLNLGQLSAAGGATAICLTVGTIIPGGYLPPFPGINDIKVIFENGVGIAGRLTVNTFGSVVFQTIDSGPYGGTGPNGFAGTSISWNTI